MIIGITGTIGAGKGTIVEHLKAKGFKHFSVREYLTEEIKKRNLPVNRDSMVVVANDLREKNYPSYIVEQLYKKAAAAGGNCAIESIRTPGEVEALKQKGEFCLLAVDADPRIRYERVRQRKSLTDEITFEKFLQDEKREMDSTDHRKQNISQCIAMADFAFTNNGNIEELYEKIDAVI